MDAAAPLSTELLYLAWSALLLFLHIAAQGGLGARELGFTYNAGPRDEERKPVSPYANRARRALANFSETYPVFIALALGLAVSGKVGGIGAVGAALWFWGRVAYLPLYVSGVSLVRTLAWGVSVLGLALMFFRLLG